MNGVLNVNKKELIDANLVYKKIRDEREKYTPYQRWITRHISAWGFTENKDFLTILSKSTGGRRATQYYITYDMAKHLCILDKSEYGMKARQYYIDIEKEYKKGVVAREVGKEVRKELTASIDESGENERMHGFGYSSYTKLAYKLCNIEYKKNKTFRDTLNTDQLKRVKIVEDMIKSLLEMGKQYKEIKDVLEPLFKDVKNKTKELSNEK